MLDKNGMPLPNVEKMSTEEENSIQTKTKRTADDIKKVFIDNYGFEEDDPKLAKMVEREVAHSKIVSKLIGQKIKLRNEVNNEQKPSSIIESKESDDKNDIRSIEREKAVNKVLSQITSKYEGFESGTVLAKLKSVYREAGDETLRGDFEKKLWQAFWVAYPDKYEEKIREKAAQEDEPDLKRVSQKSYSKPKSTQRKFFVKNNSPKDWFIKK